MSAAPDTLAAALNGSLRAQIGPAQHYPEDGRWRAGSEPELLRRSRDLARGLMTLGVQRGDRVAILGTTAPEWTVSDLAALWAGAVTVPIDSTTATDECEYILRDSGARVALCEGAAQVLKVEGVRGRLPGLAHVVDLSGLAPGAISTEILLRSSGGIFEADLDLRLEAIDASDPCTVVYTPGPTGAPKGCVLTQADLLSNVRLESRCSARVPAPWSSERPQIVARS